MLGALRQALGRSKARACALAEPCGGLQRVAYSAAQDVGPQGSGHDGSSSARSPGAPPPLPPPPFVAGVKEPSHWLDRRLPGLRLWLEEKNRQWWIDGLVKGRCSQYHQLEGREAELRQAIEKEFQAAMARHAAQAAADERAETHVQVACLALASRKALLPWLRDEGEVLQIIREHTGGRTAALLRFLLAATKFLHRDGYATLVARLRGLRMDLGAGFESQLDIGDAESTLTITRCLYHDIFSSEDVPQLTCTTCCSQDVLWFEPKYRGAEAGRTAALSLGDPACCFRVRRIPR